MSTAKLQSEPGELARTDLPAELAEAIELASAAQNGRASWEDRDGHRALALRDDVTFLPDEREAISGSLRYIGGIVIAILGVAFTHMGFADRKAEEWMPIVGPILLVVGAYLFWKGRKANAEALSRPRLSGVYLVGDTLLYYREGLGCQVFPAASIQRVEWEAGGADSTSRLNLYFVDEEGKSDRRTLCSRNLQRSIAAWLGRHRQIGDGT